MFKNLSPRALGTSGRQSEIIELALTYGFHGIDMNFGEYARRASVYGIEHSARFVLSAKKRPDGFEIGGFDLPFSLKGEEAGFRASLEMLRVWVNTPEGEEQSIAASVGVNRCLVVVDPFSDTLALPENFELHRTRLGQVAEVLAEGGLKLGVGLQAAAEKRKGKTHEFIHQAAELLKLISSVGADNVGLLLDLWNWKVGGGTMAQLREFGADKVVAVRANDVPEGADLATIGEQDRLLPGESGETNAVEVLEWLKDADYDGPVTVFPHPRNFKGMTRDAIVQRAGSAMNDLWVAIGLVQAKESEGEAVAVGAVAEANGQDDSTTEE
ncbi:sugar phosphate isomerase/epimerase family protein [Lignipirellula cremea]|uniref:Xylose isomerase-like TIM barrel n=1 Tax=Lignipirellula cremea TaxID=2528010 RepID=A0A518DW01_9BACT|nr:TIM barrel protein [Lignipirellula cremea]QDU96003.1 Xylose isomerase-like TIM barrel [Lignipirellula cremea]